MDIKALEIQCDRIVEKLTLAKSTDGKHLVFGASSHRYGIEGPLSDRKISDFENNYGINIPIAFRLFLSRVGNGNKTPHLSEKHLVNGCCAGPYYGLFPLGEYTTIGDNIVLSNTPTMGPNFPVEKWKSIVERLEEPSFSDEEYDEILDKVYAGILPLGHQGCSGWQGLILVGENVGRVVYFDEELIGPPTYTRYDNFLDWYESWLDGVISGPHKPNDFEGTIYMGSRKTK